MLIAARNINSHNFLHFPSYPSPSVIWSSKQTKFNSFCDMKLWKPQLACRRQTNAMLRWTCRSVHMDAYTISKYDFSTGEKMNKETSNSTEQTNQPKWNLMHTQCYETTIEFYGYFDYFPIFIRWVLGKVFEIM